MITDGSTANLHCDHLRNIYRSAFAKWGKNLALLQTYIADPTATNLQLETARRQSDQAEIVYRESRDLLWRCMTGNRPDHHHE